MDIAIATDVKGGFTVKTCFATSILEIDVTQYIYIYIYT